MQHCLRSCKIQGKQEQTMCIFVQWFLSAVVSCGLSFPADKAAGHLAILGLHWGSRGWLWGIASGLPVTESCSRGSKGDRVWARTSSHFYRTCLAPHTHTHTYTVFPCFEPVIISSTCSHMQLKTVIKHLLKRQLQLWHFLTFYY